jgi:Protein of unknown function (DUF3455)
MIKADAHNAAKEKNPMYRKFIASFLPLLVAGCASPQKPTPAFNVPDKLKPRANESLAMIVPAKGVQIYECRGKKDQAGVYEWAFVAPEADLFDTGGKKIGKHYAGPHWESTDGSKVAGTVKERADAPQAGAIPWLLLVTKSVGSEGSFSKITSIQRVNTVGGVQPKTACSQSSVGTTARVPYTADYYFLTEK